MLVFIGVYFMKEDIIAPPLDIDLDDKPIWFNSGPKSKRPKPPKYPVDEDIQLWLKHNAPQSYQQLVDIRYVLYHRCSRDVFVITERNDEEFTITGRHSSLRIINDKARHYLLWRLRLLGQENNWIGALPRTKKPRF